MQQKGTTDKSGDRTLTAEGNNFANDGNLYGYSVEQSTGALTPL